MELRMLAEAEAEVVTVLEAVGPGRAAAAGQGRAAAAGGQGRAALAAGQRRAAEAAAGPGREAEAAGLGPARAAKAAHTIHHVGMRIMRPMMVAWKIQAEV
jgi:hypothetical protein